MSKVKIGIVDAEDTDVVGQACQLGEFGEQVKVDSGSCDAEDGTAGGWIEDNCHGDRKVGIDDAVLDSEVSDEFAGMGIGCRSRTALESVYKATAQSRNWLESANHSGEEPGWAVEEEVELDRIPGTKLVMHRAHQVVEHHCSLAKDVCLARLAADDRILERPAVEEQQIEWA
jgi:hypothetical protein